jgi:hypothetical protein
MRHHSPFNGEVPESGTSRTRAYTPAAAEAFAAALIEPEPVNVLTARYVRYRHPAEPVKVEKLVIPNWVIFLLIPNWDHAIWCALDL